MKYIYFDFDGTIANSVDLGIEIIDILAPKHGFKTVDKSKIDYYRNLSSQDLIKEFNIPLIKLPFLAPLFKIELSKRIDDLNPYPGIKEMLEYLSGKYFLGILTSNNVDNVNHFLEKHELAKYFSDVRSEFQMFGKHLSLKKIIKKNKIKKNKFIYVGDETRDIEAAKKVKAKTIAITWGFGGERILRKYNPDFIVSSAEEITACVDELFAE
ncbi:MAG: HAD-IA family hydrolase [Bacteroidota bacterium]|nr:HAD-IA family hydrolase [Bacteroidota bacterium]